MTTQSSRAERLAKIAERMCAATQEPWRAANEREAPPGSFILCYGDGDSIAEFSPCGPWVSDKQAGADLEFCAHARSDIPWLLSELEAADNGLIIVGGYLKTADADNARLRSALEEAKEALSEIALNTYALSNADEMRRRAAEVAAKLEKL